VVKRRYFEFELNLNNMRTVLVPTAAGAILTLLSTIAGGSPYTQAFYPTSTLSEHPGTASFKVSAETFSQCTCDLTAGGCDQACCCDPDCSAGTVAKWRLNKNFCLDEINDQKILTSSQCFDRTLQSQLLDLQDGLKVYGKNIRSLFCVSSSSSRDVVSSFISERKTVEDAAAFNETIASGASLRTLSTL
jgi:hypothetical protein